MRHAVDVPRPLRRILSAQHTEPSMHRYCGARASYHSHGACRFSSTLVASVVLSTYASQISRSPSIFVLVMPVRGHRDQLLPPYRPRARGACLLLWTGLNTVLGTTMCSYHVFATCVTSENCTAGPRISRQPTVAAAWTRYTECQEHSSSSSACLPWSCHCQQWPRRHKLVTRVTDHEVLSLRQLSAPGLH